MIKKLLNKHLLPKIYKFYLAINLKTRPFQPSGSERCLLLAPHADDESIGAGGTLVKHGKLFDVVCLTNGVKGVKGANNLDVGELRRHEFVKAVNIAGVHSCSTLNIPDKGLISAYNTFKTIDISGYDCIFIPNILDQHQDHKAVSINLGRLLQESNVKKNLQIVMYEVWSALAMPNLFVDISDVQDKKREMIGCHKSQIATRDYTSKALALNEYRGLPHNIAAAEAFLALDVETFQKAVSMITL